MTTLTHRFASAGAMTACTLLALLPGAGNAQDTGATAPSTTVGTRIDDAVIGTNVRTALMSIEGIKNLDIKIKTHKGVVMLSGFADSQDQIDRAIVAAVGVHGVKNVVSLLNLKDSTQALDNKIDDSVLTSRVWSALRADQMTKSLNVVVTTKKGEVQLSGYVDDAGQLSRATYVASSVNGVSRVINDIIIKK
jgi:hyperosmotically inducible protein